MPMKYEFQSLRMLESQSTTDDNDPISVSDGTHDSYLIVATQFCAYAARIFCSAIYSAPKCLRNEELWLSDSFRSWVFFGLTRPHPFITIRPSFTAQVSVLRSGVKQWISVIRRSSSSRTRGRNSGS